MHVKDMHRLIRAFTNADAHIHVDTEAHTVLNAANQSCTHCMSRPALIFIRPTMAGMLTAKPACLAPNMSIFSGLHKPRVYTVTGHDLILAAISLTSPTRCLFSLILLVTKWCYQGPVMPPSPDTPRGLARDLPAAVLCWGSIAVLPQPLTWLSVNNNAGS